MAPRKQRSVDLQSTDAFEHDRFMSEYPVTDRNRVRRLPSRAAYDRCTVHEILDAEFLCHVGLIINDQPVVLPTAYARDGDSLILHGSAASRMLRQLSSSVAASVSVAIADGLVLARSAFHHSVNYRSVVLFGTARLIDDPREKERALACFMEHLAPGRLQETRSPSVREMKGTSVLRFSIAEASAKTRDGDPVDDAEDHGLDVWAGVVPLARSAGNPRSSNDLQAGLEPSEAVFATVKRWSR